MRRLLCRLTEELHGFIRQKMATDCTWQRAKIILSGHEVRFPLRYAVWEAGSGTALILGACSCESRLRMSNSKEVSAD